MVVSVGTGGERVSRLPRLAIAMGDPAGVGPEIIVKALAEPEIYDFCEPVVIGDAGVLMRAPGWPNGEPRLDLVDDVESARPRVGRVSLLDLGNVPPSLKVGEASAEGGRACLEYLEKITRLAIEGKVDAVVFGPLNKEAMKKAGSPHTDEYGLFARMCGVDDYSVLMVGPHFTLASVTLHLPFSEVSRHITKERVLSTIRHGERAAQAAGVEHPRIGVAALNPHAGEGGTLGKEEQDVIGPAVAAAVAEGHDVEGPFPADTFFMTTKEPRYDVYVGMYHDQGRIALKLLDFGRVTTMAEGLPAFFCTVGHGTAYDIAGKGIAHHE
ncbi:MAG TPA: 4-hydroxythreonine-4-phosphate dehydrogenase PdxA, partial [Chloroflexota bacterium]|nr:4-hydroxythreonine-4-phosphate dehydrogenase PdxA [Chloroflexota bacterium]